MGKVELTDFEREYSYLRYGGSATEFMLDNPKAVQMIKEEARVVLELAEKEVKRLDSLKEHVSEDLEEASKEWLRPRLDESYANYGEDKMMELTRFDGYAMLDAIEFGAKWKEEQMIANSADAMIGLPYENKDGGYTHLIDVSRPLPVGDNKIAIIVKED